MYSQGKMDRLSANKNAVKTQSVTLSLKKVASLYINEVASFNICQDNLVRRVRRIRRNGLNTNTSQSEAVRFLAT